jgi:hypothetical protein
LGDVRSKSQQNTWNDHIARCDRELATLGQFSGAPTSAAALNAVNIFRSGEDVEELAEALLVRARVSLSNERIDEVEPDIQEAISIAAPRGFAATHSSCLSTRAHLQSLAPGPGSVAGTAAARDAAEAAYRIAVRHRLAWPELEAAEAHAALDAKEKRDLGWTLMCSTLRARLVPDGLEAIDSTVGATAEGET